MADFSITKRIARLPCGGCRSNCSNDCVKCSLCNNWYHRKCQQISADEMKIWKKIELGYVCVSCRTLDGIEFVYLMGMRRLKNAADTKVLAKLKTAVTRETLFKIEFKPVSDKDVVFPPVRVDAIAKEVMNKYFDEVIGDPIITTGNGNCLFNAVSLLLYGDESKSVQLRYHICLRMVRDSTSYMNHLHRKRIQCLSPSYEATCIDCATIGVNGVNDFAHTSLNTTFKPSSVVPAGHSTINILWYAQGQLPKQGSWYAVNHFVPVLDMKCKSKNPLTYYKDNIDHRYKEYDNSEDDNIVTLDSLNCSVGLDDDTDILQTDEYGKDIYIMEAETTGECCESLDPIVYIVLDVNTDHKSAPLQTMRPASNPGKFMTNEELLKVIKSTEIGEKASHTE
ncbi:hypothetical protein ACJMK2_027244 [Sinanodonta woodiana]|uniref:Uncharacterized protein n=1 Tax=Sinanodonta woodiana TaxID=1069815 RepID=A0ABD3XQH2_SINWO